MVWLNTNKISADNKTKKKELFTVEFCVCIYRKVQTKQR